MTAPQGYHSRDWSQLGIGTLPGSRAMWVTGYSKDWLPGRMAPTPAKEGQAETPPAAAPDSNKKSSLSPKTSQSWPSQGQYAAALKGRVPHLRHNTHQSFTTLPIPWQGGACLSFPSVQTNP